MLFNLLFTCVLLYIAEHIDGCTLAEIKLLKYRSKGCYFTQSKLSLKDVTLYTEETNKQR